ncbi:hypothetical protein [Pedobacter changchengzhani]|uniref:hypothetical protein n=1 Tax=Pedobacter changchengzhani TaxID=2529274 RepID=UPI0014049422|nr:hypothetical protein [Pedobacter changchengzhani]
MDKPTNSKFCQKQVLKKNLQMLIYAKPIIENQALPPKPDSNGKPDFSSAWNV